jgi:DNA helicase HerA-like ATPase
VIVEELLVKTKARILVIDPNSDYKCFSDVQVREDITKGAHREYTANQHEKFQKDWNKLMGQSLRFGPNTSGLTTLQILFSDLSKNDQVTLLDLDAIRDREEYSTFREVIDDLKTNYGVSEIESKLKESLSIDKTKLLYRFRNREIGQLLPWGRPSVVEMLLNKSWKFASIDLGQSNPLQRSMISGAVLRNIYEQSKSNRQHITFIVIDEAHNFCPRTLWYEHQETPRQVIQEIAAEGRKYGVFLVLLTQSPSKLSDQVLLQCDNMILMRMTSPLEVGVISSIIGGSSSSLAETAFTLSKGQAICLGGFVRGPTGVKFDLRKTKAGGDDLGKDWARKPIQ